MSLLLILNPANKSEAGLVLFLILLGAAIIGFVVAWLMFRSRVSSVTESLSSYQSEVSNLKTRIAKIDHDNINLLAENNALQMDLDKCREVTSGQKAMRKPEVIIDDIKTTPFGENDETYRQNAERLGFKLASGNQKDDLKRISGVGPFIEKKLNNLGIFTFDQISDFNSDTINKVTEAIEFFPGRIERDNWVDQAKNLKT